MHCYDYIILGAGPAGLTAANKLLDKNIGNFIIIEKEKKAGGLCRTEYVDGNPVDIGGGHILDKKNKKVDEFMFRFLPQDQWNEFTRDSQILFKNNLMGSPFEAHIWQLPVEEQVEYLKTIAVAGCNLGLDKPKLFIDWINWKLGTKIAEEYMLPYNKKMFSKNLNQLGTYWLDKLPNVSFEDTLMSCLEHRFYGQQPCHTEFYYPKNEGFGDNFIRMQERLGDRFISCTEIKKIDFDNMIINDQYRGKKIIVTIPWTEFKEIIGMPREIIAQIGKLKYSSVQIDYYKKKLFVDTTAQWIYVPSDNYSYHRIMVMENFALGSQGYWTETNSERLKLCNETADFSYLNKYAYPLNTMDKNEAIKAILEWSVSKGVYGLGRWGEWQHFNADIVMERAMNLIEYLTSNIG